MGGWVGVCAVGVHGCTCMCFVYIFLNISTPSLLHPPAFFFPCSLLSSFLLLYLHFLYLPLWVVWWLLIISHVCQSYLSHRNSLPSTVSHSYLYTFQIYMQACMQTVWSVISYLYRTWKMTDSGFSVCSLVLVSPSLSLSLCVYVCGWVGDTERAIFNIDPAGCEEGAHTHRYSRHGGKLLSLSPWLPLQ